MKKKLLAIIISLTAALCLCFGISACAGVGTEGGSQSGGEDGGSQTPSAKEYTVTYDANGGMFADGQNTYTQTVKEGNKLTAPTSPTRKNYTFAGWGKTEIGSDLWDFSADKVTEGTTLYAKWEQASAVLFSVEDVNVEGNEVFLFVEPETEEVNLTGGKVVCSEDSTWHLYRKGSESEIYTKTASLTDGNNEFSIVVASKDGENTNTYNLTVHRKYTIDITYMANGTEYRKKQAMTGSLLTENEYDIPYTLTGYTFNGWVHELEYGETILAPLTFTADLTAKTYRVTFDSAGGSDVAETTVTFDENYSFSLPARTGYTFLGWWNGSTQLTEEDGSSIAAWDVDSDTEVTAHWEANRYSLVLNNDCPECGEISGEGEYDYDETVTIRATVNEGYNFLGWFAEDDTLVSEEANYTFPMGLDTVLTAKWNFYTLTTQSDNEAAGSVTRYDQAKTTPNKSFYLYATTESGYTFTGWYIDDELVSTDSSYYFTMPKANVVCIAKWIEFPITIELSNLKAGRVAALPSATHVGQQITITAETNKGYTWLGWYCDGELLTEAQSYTFELGVEETVYTANWTYYTVTFHSDESGYVPATVTFDLNGADGAAPEPQLITPTKGLVYPTIPVRSGYVFCGWYKDTDCEEIFDFSAPVTESIVLYAGWFKFKYDNEKNTDVLDITTSSGSRTSCYYSKVDPYENYSTWQEKNPRRDFYFSALTGGKYSIDFDVSWGTDDKVTKKCYRYDVHGRQIATISSYSNIEANAGDVFLVQFSRVYATSGASSGGFTETLTVSGGKLPTAGGISRAHDSENKVTAGESITVTTAAQEGYAFLGWYQGDTRVSGELDYTFTMPEENITLVPRWCEFALERNDENAGEVFSSQETYDIGDSVTITAVTNDGYVFTGWYRENEQVTGDLSYTFSFTGESTTYTAHWIICPVKVESNSPFAGTITSLDGAYKLGDEITITAVSNEGYFWLGWYTGDDRIAEGLSYTFVMSTDEVTYTAKWYTEIRYIGKDGEEKEYRDAEIEFLKSAEQRTLTGWYLFLGAVTGDVNLTVSGEANIILADGCEWTVNNIFVTESNTLNIYAQSSAVAMGKLTVLGNIGGANGSEGYHGTNGEKRSDVGTPGSSGGSGGKGSDGGTISISGGCITVTNLGGGDGGRGGAGGRGGNGDWLGGRGGDGGRGGAGGNNGTLSIYGGQIIATRIGGGDGGDGGYGGGGGDGRNAGKSGSRGNGGDGGNGGNIIIHGGTIQAERMGTGYGGKMDGGSAQNGSKGQVFYHGNQSGWAELEIPGKDIIVYYYSGQLPDTDGNYWCYDENEEPVIWGSFHVSFDLNGADGTPPATQLVTTEIGLTYPPVPSRKNYAFRGWFTESSCQNIYDFTAPISSDLTLYAGWQYMGNSSDTTYYSWFDARKYSGYNDSYRFTVNRTNTIYNYFTALTGGEYKVYYWVDSSGTEESGIYIYIRNVTKGEDILVETNCHSASTHSATFQADAGDVISIRTRRVSTDTYSDLSIYVYGAKTPTDGGTALKLSELASKTMAGRDVPVAPLTDGKREE